MQKCHIVPNILPISKVEKIIIFTALLFKDTLPPSNSSY